MMSVDYSLQIETKLTPRQVFEIPARVANTEIVLHIIDSREDYTLRVPSVWAVAVGDEALNEISKKVKFEAYGFIPTVIVTFEFYASENAEAWKSIISESAASILKEVSGKAYFLYDREITIAERLDERCLLTNDPQYDWLAKGFDEVEMKYERRPLESPFQ